MSNIPIFLKEICDTKVLCRAGHTTIVKHRTPDRAMWQCNPAILPGKALHSKNIEDKME